MGLGFFEVSLDQLFQTGRRRSFDNLRQRLDQLLFGAMQVFDFVQEQIFHRIEFHRNTLVYLKCEN